MIVRVHCSNPAKFREAYTSQTNSHSSAPLHHLSGTNLLRRQGFLLSEMAGKREEEERVELMTRKFYIDLHNHINYELFDYQYIMDWTCSFHALSVAVRGSILVFFLSF